MDLTRLSDDQILGNLKRLARKENTLITCVIGHLVEVERRKLFLKSACSSLYSYCIERLGYSEDETHRRIVATRLALRFPVVLERLKKADVGLSVLVLLRPHLNADNCVELLDRVAHKSKRQAELLLAALAPKSDIPATINGQPATTLLTRVNAPVQTTTLAATSTAASIALAAATDVEITRRQTSESPAAFPPTMLASVATEAAAIERPKPAEQVASYSSPPSPRKPFDKPLSEHRHKVEFTASTVLRDKLERARNLMTTRNPRDQFAAVIEEALDLLLAKLERERLGKLTRVSKKKAVPESSPPQSRAADTTFSRGEAEPFRSTSSRKSSGGRITRPVRRAVFERDGERCSFVDEEGHRCSAKTFLEVDHRHPRALGGTGSDVSNTRVLCRAHNRHEAERVFGRNHIEQRIHDARRGARLKKKSR